MNENPLAVTAGEPSGIGPDILLALWAHHRDRLPKIVALADPEFLAVRARRLGLDIQLTVVDEPEDAEETGGLHVLALEARHLDSPGIVDPANAVATIEAIDRATALALGGRVSALVTGPIDKKALYDAGFRHPGHTEYLAELCSAGGTALRPVMLLHGPDLSCVPVTIHIPLERVPFELSADAVEETCRIVASAYRRDFGIDRPRLAVAGLNPHAGEKGALGRQDDETIRPAVERLAREGVDIVGPLPADTMFHAEARKRYDVAICMYHDQALIPAKTLAFDETVNVTLGLPIIRTSPDHGTASDIAGTGRARHDSFLAAIALADRMADARRRHG